MPIGDRLLLLAFRAACALVLAFLLLPVLAVIPLSFNAGSFLTYPMAGWSLRWYQDFFGSARWLAASSNSAFIGALATVLATALGTAAALGLDHVGRRSRQVLNALFILPVVVPVVVIGSSLYALMAPLGLTNGYLGLVRPMPCWARPSSSSPCRRPCAATTATCPGRHSAWARHR